MKESRQNEPTQAPGSALPIVAWATFIWFVAVSIGLSYPVSYVETEIASGRMPPLPRLILDVLQLRHYWHIFPVLALLVSFLSSKHQVSTKAFRRWMWICLVVLWIAAYLFSLIFLTFFYINLFFMMRCGCEVDFRLIFAIYAMGVIAVIAWKRISSRRPGLPGAA
jgi:hypothetical protein